jgi:hypothetical protein
MLLLCCIVKHFFHIRPVLVVWRHTANQTGAFATASLAFKSVNTYCSKLFQTEVVEKIETDFITQEPLD